MSGRKIGLTAISAAVSSNVEVQAITRPSPTFRSAAAIDGSLDRVDAAWRKRRVVEHDHCPLLERRRGYSRCRDFLDVERWRGPDRQRFREKQARVRSFSGSDDEQRYGFTRCEHEM